MKTVKVQPSKREVKYSDIFIPHGMNEVLVTDKTLFIISVHLIIFSKISKYWSQLL